jgi:hypothetical protein
MDIKLTIPDKSIIGKSIEARLKKIESKLSKQPTTTHIQKVIKVMPKAVNLSGISRQIAQLKRSNVRQVTKVINRKINAVQHDNNVLKSSMNSNMNKMSKMIKKSKPANVSIVNKTINPVKKVVQATSKGIGGNALSQALLLNTSALLSMNRRLGNQMIPSPS